MVITSQSAVDMAFLFIHVLLEFVPEGVAGPVRTLFLMVQILLLDVKFKESKTRRGQGT